MMGKIKTGKIAEFYRLQFGWVLFQEFFINKNNKGTADNAAADHDKQPLRRQCDG